MRERRPARRGGRLSRVLTRAALLLLIAGGGMAALAPAAEAQTPAPGEKWTRAGLFSAFDVITPHLTATQTAQLLTIVRHGYRTGFFAQLWGSASIRACEWTTVPPGSSGTTGTCHGITKINQQGDLTGNVTPTATMISNGGFVLQLHWSGLDALREWVPLYAAKAPILELSPATVAENGGVATVTAKMSSRATSVVTVTVAATAVSPATASDFTLSTANTLTIAADGTTVTGVVTVTANDNTVDSPNNSVTISGTAASSDTGVNTPLSATLKITDDDAAPDATLALDPASISENGGLSTVTATLSHPSSQPTTVTVAAAAVSPAVAGDFSLSTATTLTVAAGATTSTGTVTVTGVDNDTDAPDKSVEVTATLANGHGAGTASAATLTLTDDDAAPDATLSLNPTSVAENGGIATVSATLSRPSSQPSTVTVTAVSGSYTVGSDATIVIAAGATTAASDTAEIAGVDDDVHQGTAGRSATVAATLTNGQGAGTVTGAALTLTDDDAVPTATLVLNPALIAEAGGLSTVTAKLSHPTTTAATTLTVTTTAVSPAVPADFTRTGSTLTIAASATTSTGLVTVTAVDNAVATGNKQVRVAATAAGGGGVANPSAATLILRDDEFGLSESAVSGQATEGGGQATFTVRLNTQPSAAVTVTVTSRDASEGTVSPPSLTFTGGAAGNWGTAQTVTVTGVQDTIDDGDVTWQVRLDPSSGDTDYNAVTDVDVDVTTTDDDGAPGVTLTLNPASIAESGTGNVATVTARLSHASGAATTVTVTAVSGFYAAGTDAAIVIPAGATTAASDTATVVAVDNTTDAPDRTETVTASITNARAAADSTTMAVTGAALTVRDDDAAPGAVLALAPTSVSENGGLSTVTATLSRPSSEPSTVTVAAVSGAYTVGTDATITIAAGATTAASDTVLVTAVDDDIHQGSAGRSVTVAAALANGQGAGAVTGAALTLTDDETLPVASLVLGPASISEEGGLSTVTATLSGPSSAAVTVTVQATRVLPATAASFTRTGSTLTIAAGATTSTGLVTVRANGNSLATGNLRVTVSGTSAGGNSVANPANVTLTLADDDTPQTALVLSSSSIAENGGIATVTATLDRQSAAAVTVTVAAAAGANTAAGDFTLSTANTLTFAANATTSAGLVTVTAVNNTTDAPDKSVTVSGMAADSLGLTNDPPDVALAITDDDGAPGVVLSVNPSSVAENGGASAVSATLSHPSSEPSTVTVTAVAGAYTVGSDATITIAAGSTTAASDTAAIAGVNDDVHQGTAGRSVTVTATLTNGQGAGAVTGAALTLTDDETLPTLSLALGPSSVSENGGVSTVTAALSGPSSQATTLTVSSAAVASTGAVAGDFTQSGTMLTIAAGATTSTGAVTVRGNDNNVDADNKSVTVSATATGGNGVAAPSAATLTLTDDEATATATLVLTPSAILENGEVSTVTARLSHPTTEATTLTVSAAPGTDAVASDFNLSATTTLTIAAGGTTSTGLVTVTAVDNAVASGRKRVTVSATAAGGRMVSAPSSATLIIRDDEFGLDESAVTGQATEDGGQATFTVALQTQPSAAVTVSVTSRAEDGRADESEGRVSPSRLVFTVQNWETAQTVTVTGADDDVDDGDVAWKVRLDPSSGDVNYDGLDPVDVDVTTVDNDEAPTVELKLDPASIAEDGEVSTVTAELSHPSVKPTTVTVTAAPVSPAVADDFTLSSTDTLTIAAGATTSTGTVTITARNNAVDADDKTVRVSGTATNDGPAGDGMGVGAVESATLTITDDDEKGLAFAVAGTSATVLAVTAGEDKTYTVKLTSMPSGPVTVAVTASPASRSTDVTVRPAALTFPASAWNTAQPVTVTVEANEGGYAVPLALAHDASGGDYEDVAGSLDVSVAGETKLRVAPGTTMPPVVIKGYRVTMTVEAGVPEGIELDLEALPVAPSETSLTLTFAPVEAPAESDAFTYGSQGSRTVVDVTVTEGTVPSPGLRLCLPVEGAVQEAARGRALLLLHYDGSAWDDVDGSAPSPDGTMVCAPGVTAFSPFAVGYEDTRPVFPDDFTMTEMVFTVDEAIERVTLPEATGGDGDLDYALSPALPVGLTRDGRVLSGTPTEEFDETTYTWTATDIDGESQQAELEFTIEVIPARALALARLKAINESILPELSRAQWGSVVEAVTGRLEAPGTGGGMVASVAEALKAQEGTQDDLSWREMLAGRTFALGLGDGDIDISDFDSLYGGGGHGVVFWGSGEQRALSLEKEALSWSGEAYTALVGTDGQLTRTLRAGVAASWFESYIDYTDKSDDAAIKGAHESRMQAIHPYLGWSGDGGSRVWAVLGYGVGEIEIVDAEIVERFGVQRSDSQLLAAAAGGSVRAVSEGALTVDVKGALEGTQYSVEANGEQGVIEAVSVETHRLRLSVEGSRSYALGGGGSLTPSLEVGVRWDGGDGETGTGVEVGGGMSWRSASGAVSVEARGRGLLTHESGLNEWGAGGAVRLGAGDDGYGLSLSVLPSWGSVESGVSRLWEDGVTDRAPGASSSGARLAAELGYGFGVFEGAGVATPYLGFGYENGGDRRYRVGTRLGLGDSFALGLEAERKEAETPNHGAHIDLRVIW